MNETMQQDALNLLAEAAQRLGKVEDETGMTNIPYSA